MVYAFGCHLYNLQRVTLDCNKNHKPTFEDFVSLNDSNESIKKASSRSCHKQQFTGRKKRVPSLRN